MKTALPCLQKTWKNVWRNNSNSASHGIVWRIHSASIKCFVKVAAKWLWVLVSFYHEKGVISQEIRGQILISLAAGVAGSTWVMYSAPGKMVFCHDVSLGQLVLDVGCVYASAGVPFSMKDAVTVFCLEATGLKFQILILILCWTCPAQKPRWIKWSTSVELEAREECYSPSKVGYGINC